MERPPLLGDLVRMIIKMIVGGIVVILLVSCGVGVVASAAGSAAGGGKKAKDEKEPVSGYLYGDEDSDNAIMRVDIVGPILSHAPQDEDGGFFSAINLATYGYEVKEHLLEAAKNDAIKAVMIYVKTPGGSIAGSQAIHDGVLAVKEAGKPVIAYVDEFSASGGVWSTAAADRIVADLGSIVGSVGVNFGNWYYYDDVVSWDQGLFFGGVETRNGVKAEFLGAGLGKDLGNPWRPMTEREKNLITASAQFYYEEFVDHVVEHRPVNRQALVNEYGAMIFADRLAQERGYIDDVLNYQETLAYIAGEIGAEGDDWKLVGPPEVEKSPFEEFFGVFAPSKGPSAEDVARAEAAMCAELKNGVVAILPQAMIRLCGA